MPKSLCQKHQGIAYTCCSYRPRRWRLRVDFLLEDRFEHGYSRNGTVLSITPTPGKSGWNRVTVNYTNGPTNFFVVNFDYPPGARLLVSPGSAVIEGTSQRLAQPRPCRLFWADSRPRQTRGPAAAYRSAVRSLLASANGNRSMVSSLSMSCWDAPATPASLAGYRRLSFEIETPRLSEAAFKAAYATLKARLNRDNPLPQLAAPAWRATGFVYSFGSWPGTSGHIWKATICIIGQPLGEFFGISATQTKRWNPDREHMIPLRYLD
jgi:hypothetical protein